MNQEVTQVKAARPAPELVTMTDGRQVEFPASRRMDKTILVDQDAGTVAVRVDFRNGTTATYPFQIVDMVIDPPGSNGADATSNYNYVIVGFNNEMLRSNGAVTGIS